MKQRPRTVCAIAGERTTGAPRAIGVEARPRARASVQLTRGDDRLARAVLGLGALGPRTLHPPVAECSGPGTAVVRSIDVYSPETFGRSTGIAIVIE
jgi:hypothetical protein